MRISRKNNLRRRKLPAMLPVLMMIGLCPSAGLAAGTVVVNLSPANSCAEMQKALDGLPAGGEALLGAGQYEITRPLFLQHDDETLCGAGPATVLRLASNANCPVIVLAPPLTETRRAVTHLRLADLIIDGNRKGQRSEFWRLAGDGSVMNNNGVDVWNATDIVVEHVVCHDCRSGGLVTAVTRRLALHDFEAYGNQFDGLACYQTEESQFDGLNLHDNLAAGISLDLAFNHNSISHAVLANNDLGIFMRHSRDNVFQGLDITKSRDAGVFMAQSMSSPGSECTGNKFEELTINDCGGKAFLVNDVSCTNNAVADAHFLRNAFNGIDGKIISLGTAAVH
jgi:hypothetical protein